MSPISSKYIPTIDIQTIGKSGMAQAGKHPFRISIYSAILPCKVIKNLRVEDASSVKKRIFLLICMRKAFSLLFHHSSHLAFFRKHYGLFSSCIYSSRSRCFSAFGVHGKRSPSFAMNDSKTCRSPHKGTESHQKISIFSESSQLYGVAPDESTETGRQQRENFTNPPMEKL